MGMFVGMLRKRGLVRRQAAARRCLPLLVALATPGCESIEQFYSTKLPVGVPIDWWHDLQGGAIAQQRPPPPGADSPYPNLAQVPPAPTPTSAAARRDLAERLVSARDRTVRDAAQDPIATPQQAAARLRASLPGADPDASDSKARIEAASTPSAPAPSAPSSAATRPGAASPSLSRMERSPPAPVLEGVGSAASSATAPATSDPGPSEPAPGALPPLPSGPPPLPTIPGVAIAAIPDAPPPRPQVDVSFLPASDVMRPASEAGLRDLAARRGGGPVALLGGGDATSSSPQAQQVALPLAWRRAQAMADILEAEGVPASAVRIDAAALARGGIARLVE